MSITLYGFSISRSFRCFWALKEANIDFNYVELDLRSNDTNGAKSNDYLAHNPQGKVPTLVHNDLVITESAAILNYIGAIPKDDFIPTEAQARAKYDELSYFILSELEQPLWTNSKHTFAIPAKQRVSDIIPTAHWEFAKAQTALLKLTPLTGYALGKEFSFVDILLAQTISWAEYIGFTVDQVCLDYRQRIYARPACREALAQLKSN